MIFNILKNIGKVGWLQFGLTALIYILLFHRRVLLDITAQVQTLLKACEGAVDLPPTALFYVFTWLAAFGQCHFVALMGGAVATLAIFGLAKWWVTRYVLEDYFGEKANVWGWLALALGWVCSFPTADWWISGYYVAGQPSPNYWMNGTLAVSYPFAIALYWQSYRQLQTPAARWWHWQLLWIVLLAISKPSYLFVFGVVYPAFLLWRHWQNRRVLLAHLAPLILAGFIIIIEYYLVFLNPQSVYVQDFNRGQPSGVVIRPFEVWRLYSSNIPFSILAAVLFPLNVAVMFWTELRSRLLFWYSWAGFGASLAVSATFMQSGEEFYNWSFRFQHYLAAYLLFVASVIFVWEKIELNGRCISGRKLKWCAGLFLLHLCSGVVYLAKMWWTRSYY